MTYVVQLLDDRDPTDEYDEGEVELSVVKEGTHGHQNSWVWPSDHKIILLSGDDYSDEIIKKVQRLAETLAKELNNE